MTRNNILILPLVSISVVFYYIPFIFGQFISPFIIFIGLLIVLKRKDLDKGILIGVSIFLYWYALQLLSLEMDKADNLIDISVRLPSGQLIHSIVIFITCYVIGLSLNSKGTSGNKGTDIK